MMRLAFWRATVVSDDQPDSVLTDLTGLSLADGLAWQGTPCASGATRIIDRRKP